MTALARGLLVGVFVLIQAGGALAQEAKSPALAKQLAAALDAAKLDSIAASSPSEPGMYVAALYFSGSELLVVSAKYSAPQLLDAKLGSKAYRDIYIDLNSASDPATKAFIEDMGANGLRAKRDGDDPFDTYEMAGKRVAFDGDWKKQKMSEQDYMKTVGEADQHYADILSALLARAKNPT